MRLSGVCKSIFFVCKKSVGQMDVEHLSTEPELNINADTVMVMWMATAF
jgi:hypothetical protein